MSKTPFMPLWNGDLLADTMDLDATEVGAFMLLIIAQWQRKGASLPDDEKRLQRIARCGRNWPKVWARIEEYFERDDAGIFTVKGREVYQNVAAKAIVNSHNGARGGAAKALKVKARGLANASETLQRNASIPEPEPEVRESESKLSLAHVAEPSRFSDFWQQYPHRGGAKKGKASAQKVWDRLMKVKTPQDQIIAGAMRYAGDRQVLAGYAKDPATWLNARGWEDEIETSVAPIGGTRHDRQSTDRAFHQAIGQLADGLSAGTVQLDFASRDPFAQR